MIAGLVVQSTIHTTSQHARHGFKPRMDRTPICRSDYPAMVINKSLKAEPTSGTSRP